MSLPYSDKDYPGVKLLPLWHGTRLEILSSLFKTGYANLASTDAGYFGKGIYSAKEAEYSYRVYSKGALVVNWVACHSAYPVIDGDMPKLMGKANYENYDAHFVPVVPEDPTDPNAESYVPCKPGQLPCYSEMVVFESAQCLPRYLVELQPSLPKAPSMAGSSLAKTSAAFFAGSAAEAKSAAQKKDQHKAPAKAAVFPI